MELLDPRLALLGLGVAALSSERVRKGVGRGIGYVAAGAVAVSDPVVHVGRDIVEEARAVASRDGASPSTSSRKKAAAAD
jgi:hypothetical protein